MLKDTYIYKKEVDWSTFQYGFNIPVDFQMIFYDSIKEKIIKGQSKPITFLIDNVPYRVSLTNIKFDHQKYPKHKDLLQIRYSSSSELSVKLKDIFNKSYQYIVSKRNQDSISRTSIKLPEELKEYIILYATSLHDTFLMDYLTAEDFKCIQDSIVSKSEESFEAEINYDRIDQTATIIEKNSLLKIRKLDKSICQDLKILYNYQCQICGFDFAKKYNGMICEAHHIEPFTQTMNNNANNLIIVCPNHHRIIHNTNPIFHRKELSYLFSNGLEEKIVLNHHL